MPSAEIIAIGTELLLGSILDTNSQYLAKELNRAGIDLFRWTIVGDNPQRIKQTILEAYSRTDIIITTGGLGPTIDDPTREAAALAWGVSLEFHPKLWLQIVDRFDKYGRYPTENNRRQAYIPKGAQPIENPVGTAPAFYLERDRKTLICLPGVPAEMKYLFQKSVMPMLISNYEIQQTILSIIVHTAGIGESQIDSKIGDLETQENPTIGLSAHPGQVDIRITAKALSAEEAKRLIEPILEILKSRLGNAIFGFDDVTIEEIIKNIFKSHAIQPVLLITERSKEIESLIQGQNLFEQIIKSSQDLPQIENEIQMIYNDYHQPVIGIDLFAENDKNTLIIYLYDGKNIKKDFRHFASHPSLTAQWACNSVLDFIRINLV